MNMNKEQIGMAIKAGLELLGPDSEVAIPAKLNDGVFFLKGLLGGIAQGKISLGDAVQELAPPAPPAAKPPAANRKGRRAAKAKVRKKAATKKAIKKVSTRRKESRKKK